MLTRPDCFSATIEFDTDSIIIEENFLKEMQAAADYLLQFREETLNVVGHTDNVGSEEYNLALSRRRAQSVSNYLSGTI